MKPRTAIPFILTLFLLAKAAFGAPVVHDACRRLCEADTTCLQKCVSHAELFELSSEVVNAAADFHPTVDVRMKVLRSGATADTISLCKGTGWQLDNVLTCMRSYPSHDVLKACRKVSPKEDEQVRCLRSGRSSAQVESCVVFGATYGERLACLEHDVTALDVRECRRHHDSVAGRAGCLERIVERQEEESRRFEREVRARVLAEEAEQKRLLNRGRMPASKQK